MQWILKWVHVICILSKFQVGLSPLVFDSSEAGEEIFYIYGKYVTIGDGASTFYKVNSAQKSIKEIVQKIWNKS
jgi:hypothetical protein